MLAVGRSLLQRCSLLRTAPKYSTANPETSNVPKLNELVEDEPLIPEDVEAGVADTEEVAMIRQKLPYSQKVLKELKFVFLYQGLNYVNEFVISDLINIHIMLKENGGKREIV